jgi:hypothetical protein
VPRKLGDPRLGDKCGVSNLTRRLLFCALRQSVAVALGDPRLGDKCGVSNLTRRLLLCALRQSSFGMRLGCVRKSDCFGVLPGILFRETAQGQLRY